ncbi:uncharacterized protein C8Q71DRAFT_262043 [Rhodofomes roseus]|uniref:Uncharacterized protein n=1 Tax=Rhodofomes roseus TaxID=34475 RepID=A0ABQ8K6A6_9APHY|nr:uncharacterized protein C8Q71DRAFT_262043 [Rhodofomes roseus]KAH9832628.1 hypothetical protein C8Q71DRAFT_262043 [Rhodofomes roseus]
MSTVTRDHSTIQKTPQVQLRPFAGRSGIRAAGVGLHTCPCSVCRANPRSDLQTRRNILKHKKKDEQRKYTARLLEAHRETEEREALACTTSKKAQGLKLTEMVTDSENGANAQAEESRAHIARRQDDDLTVARAPVADLHSPFPTSRQSSVLSYVDQYMAVPYSDLRAHVHEHATPIRYAHSNASDSEAALANKGEQVRVVRLS